jgi:predicted metallo-beta-lactamase superfamily hydrolase
LWKEKLAELYDQASKVGHSVVTAAEYLGSEKVFLESKRRQLYRDFLPSAEFNRWTKTLNSDNIAKPPL